MNGGVSGWFFEVPTTGVGAAAPDQGGPRTWVGSLRVPLRAALQTLSVPGRCGQQRLPNVLPGGPVPLQDRYLPAFMCHHGGRSTAIRSADYDNNFDVEVGVRVRIVHSDFYYAPAGKSCQYGASPGRVRLPNWPWHSVSPHMACRLPCPPRRSRVVPGLWQSHGQQESPLRP